IIAQRVSSISPSAYVVLKDVEATNECSRVGNSYASLTLSFGPGELSTAPHWLNQESLNYEDIWSNCSEVSSYKEAHRGSICGWDENQNSNSYCSREYFSRQANWPGVEHCTPTLIYPFSKFGEFDPAWKSCTTYAWNPIFDPPRTLEPAAAIATEVPTNSDPRLFASATPAASLLPPLAPATKVPDTSTPTEASQHTPSYVDPVEYMDPQRDPSDTEGSDLQLPAQDHADNSADPKPGNNQPDVSINNPAGVAKADNSLMNGQDRSQKDIGILVPNGSPITTNGVIYSLAASAIAMIKDGKPFPIPTIAAIALGSQTTPILTFGGSTYKADTSSAFTTNDQKLTPGGTITISGTPILLSTDGTAAIIGSSTQTLLPNSLQTTNPPTPLLAPLLTFGGSTYTADKNSAFTIKGQTLTPGGTITIPGTSIALSLDGTAASMGSSSQILLPTSVLLPAPPQPTPQSPLSLAPPPTSLALLLTLSRSVYTADTALKFTIDGRTLVPGSAIMISSTQISLASNGQLAVIGSSTQRLLPTKRPTLTPKLSEITVGGHVLTAIPGGKFVVDGQTVSKGQIVTISGTPLSVPVNILNVSGAGGGDVTGSVGIGGWVMSAFNPQQSSVVPFEGSACRSRRIDQIKVVGRVGMMVLVRVGLDMI
ncbi:uncharacterized protein KY384_001264, partial [Bacidia gigantensis]|uniref:uncharacterized protein n=1 Tax=Bacidia gigantensis TaxID=2732470 RepID=UPI001D05917D